MNKIRYKNKRGERITIHLVSLILFLLFGCLDSSLVLCSPVPLGIDGRIYHLDGNTEVMEGIPINITNLDTNETIELETGRGSSGRYSVALDWNKGSRVEVKAYNPEHESARNITLRGIIHGFDILLNMTISPRPPQIKTEDLGVATEDKLYSKEIEVFDWNQDNLTFFLKDGPEGMKIHPIKGEIEWIPDNDDVGEHMVELIVRDEHNYTSKELPIFVENVNDPPLITSNPNRNAKIGEEYSYEIEASDEDANDTLTFFLLEHPAGMIIKNKSTIIWTPNANQTGKHKVSLKVEDKAGAFEKQEYSIMVPKKDEEGKSGNSGGGSGSRFWSPLGKEEPKKNNTEEEGNEPENQTTEQGYTTESNEIVGILEKHNPETGEKVFGFDHKVYQIEIKNKDSVIKEVRLREPDIEEIKGKKLNKLVYEYTEIETNNLEEENEIRILFKIERNWLERWHISEKDIVLEHFNGQEWEALPTHLIEANRDYLRYESYTDSLSLFAITHKEDIKIKNPEPSMVEVEVPNIIFGSIEGIRYKDKPLRLFFIDVKEGIKKEASITEINSNTSIYEVEFKENLSGEKEYKLETKQGILKGRLNITDSKTRLDFNLANIEEKDKAFKGITGNFVAELFDEKKTGFIGIGIIVFVIGVLIILRYYSKRKKNV